MSAGGSFLNSGYGFDEIDVGKEAWKDTSRAQSTTIIPTRADVLFCDLIRFEPYPDPRVDPYHDDPEDPDLHHTRGVNYGVVRNLAAGANMRPAEHKTVLEESTSSALALAQHNGAMFAAWKASGNDNISIAKVLGTTLMGIDGVEGVQQKVILAETSDTSPAIASHGRWLFLAWKGSGNNQLNIAFSTDDGRSFTGKKILAEESEFAPALASHDGRLYLAWTGLDENLNVANVTIFANTAGGAGVEGIEGKVALGDTSEAAPALCSHNGRLFLGWKGSGKDDLNLAFLSDGVGFGGKHILSNTSSHGPSLASHGGRLFFSWKGSGNNNLNVARLTLIGNTAGGFAIEGIESKVTLADFSEEPPAIASWNDLLFIGWKGESDDNLDSRVSRDGSFAPVGPWLFADRSDLGYYLAAFRAAPTHPNQLVEPLDSLGLAYIVEKQDMDARGISFETFKQTVFHSNNHLTPTLDYGGIYQFNTIDARKIDIWFEFVELKFRARVVDMSEPIEDFSTLPLVSGEFVRAPSGHDGLIEIRSPGCGIPLVLDFRNPEKPTRLDNIGPCPEPWLDRAQALLRFAQKLSEAGRHKEVIASLTDRAEIFRQLAAIDPVKYGPSLDSALNLLAGILANKFAITIDATRLFFRSFIIPGVTTDWIDARALQTLPLAPGSYHVQIQSGIFADFSFTITAQGTINYDSSCDAFLGGRGTSQLVLSGVEVTLDASRLTGADNGGGVLLASAPLTSADFISHRTIRLLPQSLYMVQQSSGRVADAAFSLKRDGTLAYDLALDVSRGGCLAGAGTTTLTFHGYTIVVDATAGSHLLIVQPIWGMKPAQTGVSQLVVLPAAKFILQLDSGVTDLMFSVDITGKIVLEAGTTGQLEVVNGVVPTVRLLPH